MTRIMQRKGVMHRLLVLCLAAAATCAVSPAQEHEWQKPLIRRPDIAQDPPRPYDHSQGYSFDPLLHLPGISPYFDAVGFGLVHSAPLGCNVTAASYLVRHASIYANDDDYDTYMEPFLSKWQNITDSWTGPLKVLNEWKSPYTDPEKQMEQITPSGKNESYMVAKHLLARYPDLVPTTRKVYADKKSRTQDTARAFVKAFPQDVELVEIAEDGEFQAVVPHKTCKKFTKKAGKKEQEQFAQVYTRGTIERLRNHAPVNLTTNDIIGLQQLCGYESAITGKKSKLCDIFTPTEMMAYEYLWDLRYFYMVGPGNPLSVYLGLPWLNVTASLLAKLHVPEDPHHGDDAPDGQDDGQRFFVSFTHREVPPFLATALGLFNSSADMDELMPTSRINFPRSWKMVELIPFLGHIGIEKMTCGPESGAIGGEEFVRVLANSAPRPIPRCQQGPGASCEIHEFQDFVSKNLETFGDFDGVCGNKKKEKGNEHK